MQLSKYNIVGKIAGSDNYFIVNQLSGQADILEPEYGEKLENGEIPDSDGFIEKGYLVDPEQEKILFDKKYKEFIAKRDNDELQIFFVPWYACNFSCDYCYQEEYVNVKGAVDSEIVEAFYQYVDREFSNRRKYITVFGGEPLIGSDSAKNSLKKILDGAWSRGLDVAIVTNGYNLSDYIPLLSSGKIREIQVTLERPA